MEDHYIAEQDSIIFTKLDSLIDKNKTVFRNTYSFDNKLFHIFLHKRHNRIDKLKPLLDTMLNNGQIDPFYYANIIDRQQIQQDKCPTYWEYTIGSVAPYGSGYSCPGVDESGDVQPWSQYQGPYGSENVGRCRSAWRYPTRRYHH